MTIVFGAFGFSSSAPAPGAAAEAAPASSSSTSGSSGSTSETMTPRRVESGDQDSDDTPPLKSVSLTASPPSRLISQTCDFLPSRPERKASHLPSGLQRGLRSGLGLVVR